VEPDIIVETVVLLTICERKSGTEDTPCVMEILQELLCDMQVAVEKKDDVSSSRIYNRFLTERETGVVSRFFKTHGPDTSETRQTEDEVWTRPLPHTLSRMSGTGGCSFSLSFPTTGKRHRARSSHTDRSTHYLCPMSMRTCLLKTCTPTSRYIVISTL
jgi:hypothetical protein